MRLNFYIYDHQHFGMTELKTVYIYGFVWYKTLFYIHYDVALIRKASAKNKKVIYTKLWVKLMGIWK